VEKIGGMKRKGTVLLVMGGIIVLAVLAVLLFRRSAAPEKVEKLRIGVYTDSICALVYIAQQQGFFKRHGLDVSIANYGAGIYAVNDLLADKLDVATAAELVMALQVFKNRELRALGTTGSTHTVEVVARRDRGIEKPGDLWGKRIGITKNTISEFFLANFLLLIPFVPQRFEWSTLNLLRFLKRFRKEKSTPPRAFLLLQKRLRRNWPITPFSGLPRAEGISTPFSSHATIW
jgi:hypothetical protein